MKRNKLIFNSTIAFILLITVILCEEWSKKKSEMIDQTSFFFDYGTETAAFEAEFLNSQLLKIHFLSAHPAKSFCH